MGTEFVWWHLHLAEWAALAYFILIGIYTIGWYRLPKVSPEKMEPTATVTVLIAARNEENELGQLLDSLRKQYYPVVKLQILLIDDHSTDRTVEVFESFCKLNPDFQASLIQSPGMGKKEALKAGLNAATGSLVLTTDADCRPGPLWVHQMAGMFSTSECKMVLGPVLLHPSGSLLERFQVLEFMSLIGSTAGAVGVGLPVMSNGANLGFDREAALHLDAYSAGAAFQSGDDMFLMLSFIEQYGRKAIRFVTSAEAIVTTRPAATLDDFLRQRMRWVSKSRGYQDFLVILPALIVFLFNSMLVSLLIVGFIVPYFFALYVLFITLKYLIDYPLLHAVSGFMRRRNLLKLAFPLELFYPIYVVGVGVAGNMVKVFWKGRK